MLRVFKKIDISQKAKKKQKIEINKIRNKWTF